MELLSAAWLDDLARRLADAPADDGLERIGIGQLITGGPDGDLAYTVVLGGGAPAAVEVGSLDHATVTLVEDYATAAALATGADVSAAMGEGAVKVRGDVGALVRAFPALQRALAALAGD